MGEGPLTVAVVSRYALVRAGVSRMVLSDATRAVVSETAPHDGPLDRADVAVYDLAALSRACGYDELRHLLARMGVVGLARASCPRRTEGARAIGVHHIVREDVTAERLLEAIEVAAGRRTAPVTASRGTGLSGREQLILGMIAEGHSNNEIADQLFLSINSIKTYIRGAYKKIGVTTRSQAVMWVVRHGLAAEQART